jgi:hypothetical protein
MPRMDDEKKSETAGLVKLLLIGDGKVGKTEFTGRAAEAGFNLLYLDGDIGMPTLKSLPLTARKHIYALDVADTLLSGGRDSRFLETMLDFIKESTFKWNDSLSRSYSRKTAIAGHDIWSVKPGKMDQSTILALDSWTSLTESIMLAAAEAHSVDLLDTKPTEMRQVYQAAGTKATQILMAIRSLRCHVIVIAHPDEYTHLTKPTGKTMREASKENDLIVDWTKMVPRSVSKPHGFTMSKYFTDIAWMDASPDGKTRFLDFRVKNDRLSGGHFGDRKDTTEYSFANLAA